MGNTSLDALHCPSLSGAVKWQLLVWEPSMVNDLSYRVWFYISRNEGVRPTVFPMLSLFLCESHKPEMTLTHLFAFSSTITSISLLAPLSRGPSLLTRLQMSKTQFSAVLAWPQTCGNPPASQPHEDIPYLASQKYFMLITGLPAYLEDFRNKLLGLSPSVTGWQDPWEGGKSE